MNGTEGIGAGCKRTLEDYLRLLFAAAARRVLVRALIRLIFFLCFRRVLRSFSRPLGIVSSE